MGKAKATVKALSDIAEMLGGTTAERMARAADQGFDTGNVSYRGLYGEYDPSKAGNYQMFTRSPEDAGEFGNNIVPSYLKKGYNLEINGGGNNFNSIPVGQLPADVRKNLHPSIGNTARTDEIAYAAQGAGYDSVSIGNVFDNAAGEIPLKPPKMDDAPLSQDILDILDELDASGLGDSYPDTPIRQEIPKNYDPTTVDIVFDPKNIRSKYADFNPANKDSSNLLAGIGGAAVLGGAMAPQDAEAGVITRGGKRLIEAWHGSPHKFDKFSMDNIGTGEGAQAYGHGLYFADKKGVAQDYKRKLSGGGVSFDGSPVPHTQSQYLKIDKDGNIDQKRLAETIKSRKDELSYRGTYQDARLDWHVYAREYADDGITDADMPDFIRSKEAWDAQNANDIKDLELFEQIQANPAAITQSQGALYRTELDVDPDTLLDWYKPLSEQSEFVRNRVKDSLDSMEPDGIFKNLDGTIEQDASGKLLYEYLGEKNPAGLEGSREEIASQYMDMLGIKGIRYLDGNSRSAGTGSSNYVMFDDKPISIVERGNIDPALLAGMGGASALTAALAPQDAEAGVVGPLYRGSVGQAIKSGVKWATPSKKLASEYAEFRHGVDGGSPFVELMGERDLNPVRFRHAEQRKPIGEFLSEILEQSEGYKNEARELELWRELKKDYGDSAQEINQYWQDPRVSEFIDNAGFDSIEVPEMGANGEMTFGILGEQGNATPEMLAAVATSTAAGAYMAKRQERKSFWQARRDDLMEIASVVANSPALGPIPGVSLMQSLEHMDMPTQGLYGLAAAIANADQGLDAAVQQGAQVAQQPIEQTAQQVGDYVFDETGSPVAATGAYTAAQVFGPI